MCWLFQRLFGRGRSHNHNPQTSCCWKQSNHLCIGNIDWMTQPVSYDHLLSCCIEIHSHRSKESGQLSRGNNCKKTSFRLNKDVINQKLHHSSYLICSVQIISTRIDGVYEIPLSTRNFDVGISVTSISPLEWVVYKCSIRDLSRLCGIDVYKVEKSYVWTDVAVRTSSWSRDDNKLVELFTIHMLLTPLWLVLVLLYCT